MALWVFVHAGREVASVCSRGASMQHIGGVSVVSMLAARAVSSLRARRVRDVRVRSVHTVRVWGVCAARVWRVHSFVEIVSLCSLFKFWCTEGSSIEGQTAMYHVDKRKMGRLSTRLSATTMGSHPPQRMRCVELLSREAGKINTIETILIGLHKYKT